MISVERWHPVENWAVQLAVQPTARGHGRHGPRDRRNSGGDCPGQSHLLPGEHRPSTFRSLHLRRSPHCQLGNDILYINFILARSLILLSLPLYVCYSCFPSLYRVQYLFLNFFCSTGTCSDVNLPSRLRAKGYVDVPVANIEYLLEGRRLIWLPRFLKSWNSRDLRLPNSAKGSVLAWSFVVQWAKH